MLIQITNKTLSQHLGKLSSKHHNFWHSRVRIKPRTSPEGKGLSHLTYRWKESCCLMWGAYKQPSGLQRCSCHKNTSFNWNRSSLQTFLTAKLTPPIFLSRNLSEVCEWQPDGLYKRKPNNLHPDLRVAAVRSSFPAVWVTPPNTIARSHKVWVKGTLKRAWMQTAISELRRKWRNRWDKGHSSW